MVAMTGLDIPQRAVRAQIASAIQVVVQLARLSDGRRCVTSLQEIIGMEGEVITTQEIFKLERHGVGEGGEVIAEVIPTGIRPHFAERLELVGVEFDADLFTATAAGN